MENGAVSPAFGAQPEAKAQLTDYLLSGLVKADEVGWHFLYYAKTRASQEAYNFEHAKMLENEWPEVRQTWVIPRAPVASGGLAQITAPPALGSHVWTFIGAQQGRLPPELDGLFSEVIHLWQDLRSPLRGEVIDLETNAIIPTERTMVPAGTAAVPVNASTGLYTRVTPINTQWSFKELLQVTWKPTLGRAQRVLRFGDVWPLPGVLHYVAIIPVTTDGTIYSPVSRYIVVPKMLVEGNAYPCKIQLVEKWFSKEPQLDGDPDWDSTKNTSPLLLMPVAFLETGIAFHGVELDVPVAPCLHGFMRFWDSGYADSFPATNYTRWPSTFLARVQMRRDQGGYAVSEWYVTPPTLGTTGITLRQIGESTATTAVVEWSPASAGNPETRMDVATDPTFESGWLPGFRNKLVTPGSNTPPIQHTITGMVRGRYYTVRIRRDGEESEYVLISGKPLAELQVTRAGVQVLSGATLILDDVEVGTTRVASITLESIGLLPLQEISAVLSANEFEMFGLGELSSTLTPGATAALELRFTPTSIGDKLCTLTITTNAADSPFVLTLRGTGTAAEIALEQPAGTNINTGGTVAFGTVTTGSVSKDFKLINSGNAPLRGLLLSLSGTNAGDWTFSADLAVTEIAAGAYALFTVLFDPLESEESANARTALLSIASSDADEDPFTVNLTGTSLNPTAPGAVDEDFDAECDGDVFALAFQPDGELVFGGDFTEVAGTARNNIARWNADDTLDAGFDPDVNGPVYAIAVQTDGKIWIGGDFTTVGAFTRNNIALLNADGSLNAVDPNADGIVRCLSWIVSSGSVLVGGEFANIGGGAKAWLAKLTNVGVLDAGFTSEVNGRVNGITVQSDGQIVIVGDWAEAVTTTTTTEETTTTTTTEETTTTTTTEEPTTTTTTEETTTTTTEETTTTTTEETTTTTTEETTTTTTEETTTTTTEPP